MLLHILLGIQVLLTMFAIPSERINGKDMKNETHAAAESMEAATDDLTTMMRRYTAYNHWADQQLADWLRTASEGDLDREIESSFSSLKETVLHIWSAEYLWLQIVKDESAENNPAKRFNGSKDDLLKGWLQASENFSNHVKSMSLADLQVKRPKSRGEGYTIIADMIHHCMNHSTYHRGQLITMGRQAGLDSPPRTDFIYYVGLAGE
jgi:uncharacterized damage-inducible protein DinB